MWNKLIKTLTLPIGILAVLSGTPATALVPTWLLSQASGIPDIIIDTGTTSPLPSPSPTPPPPTTYPSPPTSQPNNNNARFTCRFVNGQYTVMYNPQSQPNRFYPWAVPRAMGDGWSQERRCQEISARLESYRPDGLAELLAGRENNYDVLCVTTQKVPTCRILLTVPLGVNAQVLRDQVFQNLITAEKGQQTVPINTFNGGSSLFGNTKPQTPKGVDLRPFLDPADGGTGDKLKRRNSVQKDQKNSN